MKNLYQLESGYFYITLDEPIREGDYGIGLQVGSKHFGVPKKNYLFHHDGTNLGKINAICHGAQRIILTNDPRLIEDGNARLTDIARLTNIDDLNDYIKRGIDYVEIDLLRTTKNNKHFGEGKIYSYKLTPITNDELKARAVANELYPSGGEDSCYVDLGLIEQDAFIAGVKWAREQLGTIPDKLYLQIEDKKVEKFGGLWEDIEKQKAYCDGQCDTIEVIENWLKNLK